MTSARETILGALRASLRPGRDSATIAAEANALLDDPDAIRPALTVPDPAEALALRVVTAKVGASLDRIGSLVELPGAAARYLTGHGLPLALALQPDPALRRLNWDGFELHDLARPDETAGLGLARSGIAETGSLVFYSGPETAVLNHFLPLHHIAAIRASSIVAYFEDYAAMAGAAPRNVNIITGASGTTDIEGSYVRGAHGPGFLHVVLIDDRMFEAGAAACP